jgi:dnd system-associated protein 4
MPSKKQETAPRVKRDKGRNAFIDRLLTDSEGPFEMIAQVLVFAGAYGYQINRREPVSKSGDSVRWDTVLGVGHGVDEFVGMLALVVSDDREIANPSRLKDRITIFEEFANGGLIGLEERVRASRLLPREVIVRAIEESVQALPNEADDPIGLSKLRRS